MLNRLRQAECLKGMAALPAHSVDLVLCDLPYGVTHNPWDSVIALPALWAQYARLLRSGGSVVLTAVQPFTSRLVASNPRWFQYSLIWHKTAATGHLDARRRPLRIHEDVLVFAPQSYQSKASIYCPIMRPGTPYVRRRSGEARLSNGPNYGRWNARRSDTRATTRFPVSVLTVPGERGLHPTQKPVALFEYLIRTYSHPGAVVLDNCMGSGTTAIACLNTGRHFIGFERDAEYCRIARARIRAHRPALKGGPPTYIRASGQNRT